MRIAKTNMQNKANSKPNKKTKKGGSKYDIRQGRDIKLNVGFPEFVGKTE